MEGLLIPPQMAPGGSVMRQLRQFLRIRLIVFALVLVLGVVAIGDSRIDAQTPNTAGLVISGASVSGGTLGSNIIVSSILNVLIADAFSTGGLRTLLEIRDLDDPTAQDDPMISVATYNGIDLDGDPLDDFSGMEEFEIDPASVGPGGEPLALFEMGSITAGLLLTDPATLNIGIGLPLQGVVLEGIVAPNASSFTSAPIAGAVPALLFDQIPAPFPFSGTLTDVLSLFGITPDVDLDGDMIDDAYSIEIVLDAVSCVILPLVLAPMFVRGDVNDDAMINLVDAIVILDELFSGGVPAECEDAVDINDDGQKNLADPIVLLNYLFTGGPAPSSPFPTCGSDSTVSSLICDMTLSCP